MNFTGSALQAYGKIPEKRKLSEEFSIFSEDIESENKIMYRIRRMRDENLRFTQSSVGNGSKSSTSWSDFDVPTIAKSELALPKSRTPIGTISSFIDIHPERCSIMEPSGLIKTEKWNEIWNRRRVCNPPSISVIPIGGQQTTHQQTKTHIVEMQKFPVTEKPIRAFCPNCKIDVETLVSYEYGICTFLAAFTCCFIL